MVVGGWGGFMVCWAGKAAGLFEAHASVPSMG
jgi:hypothetical protein